MTDICSCLTVLLCLGSATSHEERDNSGHLQPAAPINWDDVTTFRHVNGVTVYEQQEPDSKIATYMVSASVHATPEACLKVSHMYNDAIEA